MAYNIPVSPASCYLSIPVMSLSSSESDRLSAERHPCGWVVNRYSGGVATRGLGHSYVQMVLSPMWWSQSSLGWCFMNFFCPKMSFLFFFLKKCFFWKPLTESLMSTVEISKELRFEKVCPLRSWWFRWTNRWNISYDEVLHGIYRVLWGKPFLEELSIERENVLLHTASGHYSAFLSLWNEIKVYTKSREEDNTLLSVTVWLVDPAFWWL